MEDETTNTPDHFTLSLIALLSAATLGLVCGLFLAPQSGTRTRRKLHDMGLDARERVDEWTEDAKDTVGQVVKKGKQVVGAF